MDKKHIGSTLESFLAEEGRLEESRQLAIKRVVAWQLQEAMKAQHITKLEMARQLHTSRSQLDRLLDPDNDSVQLDTLQRAAALVGKRVQLHLIDARP